MLKNFENISACLCLVHWACSEYFLWHRFMIAFESNILYVFMLHTGPSINKIGDGPHTILLIMVLILMFWDSKTNKSELKNHQGNSLWRYLILILAVILVGCKFYYT